MRLSIEMQANIYNRGTSRLRDGKMMWHLFTDMENQFVRSIDVFPPAKVTEKAEGNMMAIIKIPAINPGESFSPSVVLRIDTTTRDWLLEQQMIPPDMMNQIRGTYCTMQKFWEIDDSEIQNLSNRIAERTGNDESFCRLAFRTVRKQMKLKTNLDERKGAMRAIREKEGDCDEHADLFIALARAADIPARRVVGHIYKKDENPEPHAWAEAFLERHGWVPIDPALGNFGRMTEVYFSRIHEGLVSERPNISLKWNGIASMSPKIDEEVKMHIVKNGSR